MEVTVAVAAVVVAAVGVLVGHDATVPVHLGALIGCLAGWRTTAASTAAHFRTGALSRPVRHLYKGTGRALRDREISRGSQSVSPCLQNNNRRGSDALVLELVLVLLPPSRLLSLSTRSAIVRVSVGSVLETGDCGLEQREREYWKER